MALLVYYGQSARNVDIEPGFGMDQFRIWADRAPGAVLRPGGWMRLIFERKIVNLP
ncbi:hypothetical protein [Pacificoceanicola onchidii]|uniref:hypothetical protein n=1 Tax=Pacificoceanicola onchidii TaxID=2562685 RepID=UPI001456003A|nr:hypothetical protein [Pacificoceanicola onchidii]